MAGINYVNEQEYSRPLKFNSDNKQNPMTHYIKCIQPYFDLCWGGLKPFEVRENDRNYNEGDEIYLELYDPIKKEYGDRIVRGTILYVLKDYPTIKDGNVVFSYRIDQLIKTGSAYVRNHK